MSLYSEHAQNVRWSDLKDGTSSDQPSGMQTGFSTGTNRDAWAGRTGMITDEPGRLGGMNRDEWRDERGRMDYVQTSAAAQGWFGPRFYQIDLPRSEAALQPVFVFTASPHRPCVWARAAAYLSGLLRRTSR